MIPMTPNDIQFPAFQGHTVHVRAINGARCRMRADLLLSPAPEDTPYLDLAGYSFLVTSEHRNQRVLFDLAFMKDLDRRAPPTIRAFVNPETEIMTIDEFHHVPDELVNHGIQLASINAVIWSHAHVDHVGDPSVFPTTTELVVGPGCPTAGYPTNPAATLLDSAFQGRQVRELNFDNVSVEGEAVIEIGGFRAVDFFNDGSFYLLHSPGHTTHHLCALCRTTEDTWVLMAGDACHSVAQLRPSLFRPLPGGADNGKRQAKKENLDLAPLARSPCAVEHPGDKQRAARYSLASGMQENLEMAEDTLAKLKIFDGRDDVFVILAHDCSLLDVIDFFPRELNEWQAKGWADSVRWKFLEDK